MKRLWLCLFVCLLPCVSCAPAEPVSAATFCADTVVTLQAYNAPEEALREVLAACVQYAAAFDPHAEGSDVWRINHANGAPVAVSGAVIEALQTAQRVSTLSGGAFDITIAPVSALWDFSGEAAALPDAQAIAAATEKVDYTKLIIEGNTVALPDGMRIDLGGVAKGYIADATVRLCRARGIKSGVLDMGGNVAIVGAKPNGEPWRVGIRNPADPYGQSAITLTAEGGSVVTSGVYMRGFDLDGVRYHHILDAKTGYPVQNGLASVTVLANDGALADALSTACMALGEKEGMALLNVMPEAEGIFILRDGTIRYTDGAAAYISSIPAAR